LQDKKNRQASGQLLNDPEADAFIAGVIREAFQVYDTLLSDGVSRETARMILPLCTQTTLYMTGNVRSWIHYLDQRCADGTQKEHRDVANSIKQLFTTQFPTVSEAVWSTKT